MSDDLQDHVRLSQLSSDVDCLFAPEFSFLLVIVEAPVEMRGKSAGLSRKSWPDNLSCHMGADPMTSLSMSSRVR